VIQPTRAATYAAFAIILCSLTASGTPPTLNYNSHELTEGRNYVKKLTAVLAVGEASGDAS